MKRVIFSVGLLLAVTSGYSQSTNRGAQGSPAANAHGMSSSISQSDAAQILVTCMNQQKFEKYYASNGAGGVNVIEKSGVQLSPKATVLGRKISMHKKDASRTGALSNFFSIGEVNNENGQVKVSLTYFYNHTKEGYKTVMVDVQLVKKENQYQIVNSNFQGDLL
jgi:hypothetical protein